MASKSSDETAAAAGTVTSHGVSVDVPTAENAERPLHVKHLSTPSYQSPIRHHLRNHSTPRHVKETLNAHSEYTNSEDDGQAQHRINQYIMKHEIGRGLFGAVHLAVDQYGQEFAVKEFSKSRLRKRAQSNILRRPHGVNARRRPGHLAAGVGLNSPLHRHSASDIHDREESGNPLYLIQEEIAIMKKLNHDNLVSLIEVLDDPAEDSLYMVLEMCKKGVIMKVGVDERADPYDAERCRHFFRDLILGIEYLHAQGVVHRDIKPDNLLLTQDDVLKIVDFGVSEMFEKTSEMLTAKSAGSPAFLPPELCVVKHGDISGKAADIWSMGITLYCLRFGRIPFEKTGVLDLYQSIRNDPFQVNEESDPAFVDLMEKLLDKNPEMRIKMPELREHPWITKGGTDPLLSSDENTADLIEPATEAEMKSAITSNFLQLLTVMKAVTRFKNLTSRKRPRLMDSNFTFGQPIVHPPLAMSPPSGHAGLARRKSMDLHDRKSVEQALAAEGVHRDIDVKDLRQTLPHRADSAVALSNSDSMDTERDAALSRRITPQSSGSHVLGKASSGSQSHSTGSWRGSGDGHLEPGKGQAHDPSDEAPMLLDIGAAVDSTEGLHHVVSESPPAAEINIYETAYRNEVERIHDAQGRQATVYLTNRVEKLKGKLEEKFTLGEDNDKPHSKSGWSNLLDRAKDKAMPEER